MNYWLFHANEEYDLKKALLDNAVNDWRVNQHKNDIKKDDKVIIWWSGSNAGCYALARTTSNVIKRINKPDKYSSEEFNEKKDYLMDIVEIEITHNFADNPVLRDRVLTDPEIPNYYRNIQMTNYSANEREYNIMLKINNNSDYQPHEIKNRSDTMYTLNTILYGPPGTGKTYNTILRAAQIIENRDFFVDNYEEAQKIFSQHLGDRIEFITFHQNYCYEDFIQGLRPDIENGNNLSFVKKDGVFKRIATRALFEYYKVLKKEEELPDNLEYEKIKELLEKVDYEDLKNIENKNVPKYVIIIDEINRANISRVFGELITLIEDDKRSHGDIPLKTTLPSGDKFIVPSNLYIIGTMNTADKSIALVDIALRRRFLFEAMYPDYTINELKDTEKLRAINKEIIKRKGYDFQIGHSYFMGNESLKNKMNKKVIPLLLEYFMNTETEVRDILNKCGFELVKENDQEKWPLEVKE